MITQSVYSTGSASNSIVGKVKNSSLFQDGGVYDAVITDKSLGKLKLLLENGTTFEAKMDNFSANIGDSLSFKALKQNDGSFALKIMGDIPTQQTMGAGMDAGQTLDLFKQANFISDDNIFEIKQAWEGEEFEEQTRLAVSKIQSKIAYAVNNLSLAAINELLSAGVSITKLNLNMLNSVLKQVNESPEALNEEQIDEMVDSYMADHTVDEKGLEQKAAIIKSIGQNKLPVTQKNIEFMEKSIKMYESANKLDEVAIARLINNEEDITLGGIYKALFSGITAAANANPDQYKEEIVKLLKTEGIENNRENRDNAKFLFKYQLPITAENMEKVSYLKNLSSTVSKEDIMNSAAKSIRQNEKAEDVALYKKSSKKELAKTYDELLSDVPKISDKEIAYLSKQNIPVTLYNLRTAAVPADFTHYTVSSSTKLMLAEIQLKLTTDAAHRLKNKDINIDTMPIAKAVEALRAAERQGYEEALDTAGSEVTKQNVNKLDAIFSAIQSFKPLTNNVFSDVINKMHPFSISGIATAKNTARIMGELEKFMTVPDKKYGDSFNKVKDQFAPLLESLKIDATDQNIRSASILTRSGMDVTAENIEQIKIVDLKINRIQDTLHPRIAAQMLKEGLNPLDAHVDEVIEYIDSYNNQYGDGLKDRVAEHIYEMDKAGNISAEDRQAMIAVYRLFNEISKNGSAAIGASLKANHSPTLRNLLDSANYIKGVRGQSPYADIKISDGDSFESAAQSEIRQTLDKAAKESADKGEKEHAALLIENLAKDLTPNHMLALITNNQMWNTPIDKMLTYINDNFSNKTGNNNMTENSHTVFEQIKNILEQGPEIINQVEGLGIPATFANIKSYIDLQKPKFLSEAIAEIEEDVLADENFIDDNSEKSPEEILDDIGDALEDKIFDTVSTNLLQEVRLIQNAIKVQNAVSRRQNQFQLPVHINGEICQLTMFMPQGYIPNKEKLDVAISLAIGDSELNAMCQVSETGVTLSIGADGVLAEKVKNAASELNTILAAYGFSNNEIHINDTKMNTTTPLKHVQHSLTAPDKAQVFALAKAVTKFAASL